MDLQVDWYVKKRKRAEERDLTAPPRLATAAAR